jgi:membrane fusion protein (multidrug efflux system)
MNPFRFAVRRPFASLVLVAGLTSGGALALKKSGHDPLPGLDSARLGAFLRAIGVESEPVEAPHHEPHKIVVTRPEARDVVITEDYVCQIHSQRHIEVRALEKGYLEAISVKEGQAVKKGDPMFKIVPILYEANRDAEVAEAQLAQLEYNFTKKLSEQKVVSSNELALHQAKLAKAQARAKLAKAELGFTDLRAPFAGIVDRLYEREGSLVEEGDMLTTLSDNSVMWVYFNVPERRYLEYMEGLDGHKDDQSVELVLATGETFKQPGKIGAIEAKFNNQTGNIPFRADFPNPDGLLRHGQTGSVRLRRVLRNAVVIPQRATFEILDKLYVYAVGEDGAVHQREIVVKNELDDINVIEKGLEVGDTIILEGGRQVEEGEKIEPEFQGPEKVLAMLKNAAE